MKCPECSHKITTKDYDAEYEWYECPNCEGAFTPDEIEEARDESDKPKARRQQGNREGAKRKKAAGSRGAQRKNAGGKNGRVQEADVEIRRSGKKLVAKGKKRRTEIAEDEERANEMIEKIASDTRKGEGADQKRHRDELDTAQILGIWQDEIQDIYHELGSEIDEINARDKALIIWRDLRYAHGVIAREQEVEHALCKEHSDDA